MQGPSVMGKSMTSEREVNVQPRTTARDGLRVSEGVETFDRQATRSAQALIVCRFEAAWLWKSSQLSVVFKLRRSSPHSHCRELYSNLNASTDGMLAESRNFMMLEQPTRFLTHAVQLVISPTVFRTLTSPSAATNMAAVSPPGCVVPVPD